MNNSNININENSFNNFNAPNNLQRNPNLLNINPEKGSLFSQECKYKQNIHIS
jgi:hypothetical protein